MSGDFYRQVGKRLVDLAIVLPALIMFLPVFAATAFLVRIRIGSPVIFWQERPGKNGLFWICKFRTMTDARGSDGQLLPDDVRLVPFGKFLRSTSLDELPELWNVLRGEMSLVGPRPLLTRYLDLYTTEQARRHDVLPGITGWAQVNGRNSLEWSSRFEMDLWYIDHCCLWLDLKIMVLTLDRVLRRSGIHAEGHVTMPEFRGNSNAIPVEADPATATTSNSAVGVIVIGAGGHAKVVVSTLRAAGHVVDRIYDDDCSRHGTKFLGIPIVGSLSELEMVVGVPAVIAIGDNGTRNQIASRLRLDWLTVIHPRATVDESAQLGAGTLVFAGSVIQAEARIGSHVIVNTGASIDHDCVVGDYSHVGPGVRMAGSVQVGKGSFLGIGCVVIPDVTIGDGVVVGAGSTVIDALPHEVVAVGNPARIIKNRLPGTKAS